MKKALNKFIPLAYGAYFNSLALIAPKKTAKLAFDLFCTPRKGRVRPEQFAYLEEAKHQKLHANGLELQTYHWEGSKETILLLHGWESNTYRWRNLITILKKEDYNIIAFDAPGHGHSTGNILNVPLYTECTQVIIEAHDPKIIIGHSVGGMNTLYNQEKYPSPNIEKIVTIGAPSKLENIMLQYQQILGFSNRVYKGLDNHLFDTYGFRIHEFTTSDFKGHLHKKGLVIHDKKDTIAPFSASEGVHANWDNSSFFVTEGFGHSMHQKEVNLEIMKFLKS